MKHKLPPLQSHIDLLRDLSGDQIDTLSSKTGIGISTIWKIRCGKTKNPGYETIALLLKHIPRRYSPRGHRAAQAAIAASNTSMAANLRSEN